MLYADQYIYAAFDRRVVPESAAVKVEDVERRTASYVWRPRPSPARELVCKLEIEAHDGHVAAKADFAAGAEHQALEERRGFKMSAEHELVRVAADPSPNAPALLAVDRRGPTRDGLSSESVPVEWDRTRNVAWKLALPTWSGSTPVIWDDCIFLNVAIDDETIELWCLDRDNGQPIWKRFLSGGNRRRRKQNMSSPSPVTDGEHVWVMTGTGILKALRL